MTGRAEEPKLYGQIEHGMIRFKCTNCGYERDVSEKYSGKRVKCPSCQAPNRIAAQPGKISEQKNIIKFRCPSCNQKIGVPSKYAGKKVRCAKCQDPLTVPKSPQQPKPKPPESPTAILRAGQEHLAKAPTKQDSPGDIFEGIDKLLVVEANAPAVEQPAEQNGFESDFTQRVPVIAQKAKKSKKPLIIISAVCAAVLIVVVIVVSIFPGSDDIKSTADVDYSHVEQFAEKIIQLLKDGDAKAAKEFFSQEAKDDFLNKDFRRLSEVVKNIDTDQLHCSSKNFRQIPEGDFYLLNYVGTDFEEQSIVISILQIDQELIIEGVSACQDFGNMTVISTALHDKHSVEMLFADIAKVMIPLAKFGCVFVVIIFLLGIFTAIAMWAVYVKADQPGWAAIVPVYNLWVLAEIADRPGWWGLVVAFSGFIPYIGLFIGAILHIIISVGVAKTFNRRAVFGFGLFFLPFIFYPILAFSND